MYWRRSFLNIKNEKLSEGDFVPELYLTDDDYSEFIKYDTNALLGKPWCVMRPFGVNYGSEIIERFCRFETAYEFIKELVGNRDGQT